jgi:dihydroorotate dehydrogenase (NAD+) catalytic subunit
MGEKQPEAGIPRGTGPPSEFQRFAIWWDTASAGTLQVCIAGHTSRKLRDWARILLRESFVVKLNSHGTTKIYAELTRRPIRTMSAESVDAYDKLCPVSAADTPLPSGPVGVDLSVQIGALRLKNPIIAASGTFGYGLEFGHLVDLNGLGGFVVKGLSLEPMQGAPPPRLCETPSGMLNAVGLQNVGVRAFVTEKLPQLRQYQTAILANVFGYTCEEYAGVIRVLEGAEGLAGYELNISCPNVKKGGMEFGGDPAMVSQVVGAARKAAVKRPLWVKLSPLVANIGVISRSAEEAGADALTVANTYPAMAVDTRSLNSRLGNLTGGLSGPAIRPITLRLLWEAKKAVKIPIIGLGGVEKAEDVLEYLAVGASAVQVGTASFADPRASERILNTLTKALVQHKASNINYLQQKFAAQNG